VNGRPNILFYCRRKRIEWAVHIHIESGRKNYKTYHSWKCCRKKAYRKTQDEMKRFCGKRYKNDP